MLQRFWLQILLFCCTLKLIIFQLSCPAMWDPPMWSTSVFPSFTSVTNFATSVHCITVFGPQIGLVFFFFFFKFWYTYGKIHKVRKFIRHAISGKVWLSHLSKKPLEQRDCSTWAPKWQKWSCLIFCGLREAPVCSTCCKTRRGSTK